jgi:hypothetical protein
MTARKYLASSPELYESDIERIVQYDREAVQRNLSSSSVPKTKPVHFLDKSMKIVFAAGVEFEAFLTKGAFAASGSFALPLPISR